MFQQICHIYYCKDSLDHNIDDDMFKMFWLLLSLFKHKCDIYGTMYLVLYCIHVNLSYTSKILCNITDNAKCYSLFLCNV